MKLEKIGMRTIKTAFAVSFTIFIAQLLNLQSPFFAGIAAIIAMQSSVSESFNMAKNRMLSTILGAIIALLFSLIAPENPFFIAIGIIIIIYLCNIFNWKKSIQLSAMVFLSILLNYEEGSRVDYALYRTLDTFIGLVIGTLINYFIIPPNIENNIKTSIEIVYSQFKKMLEHIIYKNEFTGLDELRQDIVDIEKNYNILKKEIKFNLYESDICYYFKKLFDLFENTYNHLSIISTMDKPSYIDYKNKIRLEKLFNKKIPINNNCETKDELDLVYNYHLNKIIENFSHIEYLIDEF
ncbi:uncharacterized membrane protein YgaE (UPF0421/DUF939 family) [Keratinibaculum paraultunense]|uniref:Uncharacterized membrane protein YgaE (UPF0421/DUF939 family) n=1 Tax=Keratinibaculum paraultunense TaxID=1278232 RepID=A0A4R3L0P8_9FIRM|nr:aromatic acid exporter family protein [Keratinibaculum paraultunense]QQY80078.1 aromatic acid exporter family protein [Keratinibaculum paraultunense]TCS91601.1 uncharacterized membrane protein YgaE (UPF0421/DUF939 family) [Keratinibaculum paraultunense]